MILSQNDGVGHCSRRMRIFGQHTRLVRGYYARVHSGGGVWDDFDGNGMPDYWD
jgi:hypothetical protein